MAHELQLIKHSSGILIPATPETSDLLQSKIKLGSVLVAEFRQVRNPAFHRRFFALLNLGFEYWEPTGGAISSNERKLVTGYAKFLASFAGSEAALWMLLSNIWSASPISVLVASAPVSHSMHIVHGSLLSPAITTPFSCLTAPSANIPAVSHSQIWMKLSSSSCTKPRSMFCGDGYSPDHFAVVKRQKTPPPS